MSDMTVEEANRVLASGGVGCGAVIACRLARAYIAQAAELTRLRAPVDAADKLAEAVSGLIAILDRNDTKGPIPDIEMMFCRMAAQSVRAAVAGLNTK